MPIILKCVNVIIVHGAQNSGQWSDAHRHTHTKFPFHFHFKFYEPPKVLGLRKNIHDKKKTSTDKNECDSILSDMMLYEKQKREKQ